MNICPSCNVNLESAPHGNPCAKIARLEAELAEAKKREVAWQDAGHHASEKLRLTEIQLAAALAQVEVLRDVEWSSYVEGQGDGYMSSGRGPMIQACPCCHGINPQDRLRNHFVESVWGHRPGCKLKRALAANPPPDLVVMSRKRAEALTEIARHASEGRSCWELARAALDESNETTNGMKTER